MSPFATLGSRPAISTLAAPTILLLAACESPDDLLGPDTDPPTEPAAFTWSLPSDFPEPRVPDDDPMTVGKVELGRHLFYDRRLSGNRTQSCSSCHQQERAFAEPRPRSVGSTGEAHPRASMSLANIAYQPVLTWANPELTRLAEQALIPMFGDEPVELGLAGMEDELVSRISSDSTYQRLFAAAYPGQAAHPDLTEVTVDGIATALAAFQRTMISGNSRVDQARRGEIQLNREEQLGETLFFSDRLECSRCHGGLMFTSAHDFAVKEEPDIEFHNNGLYNLDGDGLYPDRNHGLFNFTGRARDMGKFKAPTLRNIALTAPYMHDGSVPTLEAVIDHYRAGGRQIATGPLAGDGRANPNKSEFVGGFRLNPEEHRGLTSYLRALTDQDFVTDQALSNPWPPGSPAR